MKGSASFIAGMVMAVVLVSASSQIPSASTALLGAQDSRNQRGPIEGVWRIVEQRSGGRVIASPQLGKGYHIYTHGGHYAAVRESGDRPRVQVDDLEKATARELIDLWGPFVSQLGTYRISGDIVQHAADVAKEPANQSGTLGAGMRFKVEGDMLTMEATSTEGKDLRLKFVRVE